MLMKPKPKTPQLQLTAAGNPTNTVQKLIAIGKYSRLCRELSLAMQLTHSQIVCAANARDSNEDNADEGSGGA